jgi:phospholipid-transporting ATPase
MKGQHTNSSNEIVTSHYTKANWFPLALFAQLKKPVIFYFLIITFITCLPISGQDPSFLIGTLVVVILFSMIRELFEDLKRQKLNQIQNKSKGNVYRYAWLSFEERLWDEVHVGDIVAVH